MKNAMRPKIENRRFVGVDGTYVEMSDFEARWPGRKPDRSWSCHCAFLPDVPPDLVKGRITFRHVDALASVRPAGTWLMGGHWWLERVLEELEAGDAGQQRPRLPENQRDADHGEGFLEHRF